MEQLEWYEAVEKVEPYVVRISTPRGTGTGFFVSKAKTNSFCAIATAAHVVDFAHYWEEPIRLDHIASNKSLVIRENERAVFVDSNRDTAVILFNNIDFIIPDEMLILAPKEKYLKVGIEVGWLGFPAIGGADLSFFTGRISSWVHSQDAYLVDGVAINGVSGGPAFHLSGQDIFLIGVVSAYIPNRATGESLPGLGVIRNITQFHELIPTFDSLDQAKSQETPASVLTPVSDAESNVQVKTKHTS
ncbi:MAG: serine protease [Bacteroidetes bacterium]|nr:serine protease [Bacteroidota bacterium]